MALQTNTAEQTTLEGDANQLLRERADPKKAAAECLVQAKGDEEKARWLLKAKIMNEPPLRAEIIEPYLNQVVDDLIRGCRSTMRQVLASPNARGSYGLKELVKNWFDWPLRSGIRLGDATKEDLKQESAFYEVLAATHSRRCSFFKRLASNVAGNKKLSEVMTVDRVAKIAQACQVSKEDAA